MKREKKYNIERIRVMIEHISEERRESQTRMITRIAKGLKKETRGLNENMFWEYKKKTTKRIDNTQTAMKNERRDIVEDINEIKEVYAKFYEDLLQTPKAETEKEKKDEDGINEVF